MRRWEGRPRRLLSRVALGPIAPLALTIATLAALLLGGMPAGAAGGTGTQRSLERVTLPEGFQPTQLQRPATATAKGTIEVIIQLKGNSLAHEQSQRRSTGLPELRGSEQKGHVRGLKLEYETLKGKLESRGARVTRTYGITFNGVAARVDATKLKEIASLPEVEAVLPIRKVSLDLDKSVPFVLGDKTFADLGADGTGITLAIIDTGIDYTHAALGGSGNPADYAANDPAVIEPGSFPTAKVVGGTDLVGDFYDPACVAPGPPPACTNVPQPDPDPLDQAAHGTHVASIAAGMAAGSVPHGVAPAAKLLAVKVFGLGSATDADVVAGIEFALDPNQDGDISDKADVINMSLGSPFGTDFDPLTVASNAAAELGVIVVASAGNDGAIPYITGSPASASGAISVAASNDPGIAVQPLQVLASAGADGDYESIEASFTPPLATVGPVSGPAVFAGLACDVGGAGGPNPFAPGSLLGKTALVQRGVCRFDEKVQNVEEAGAIAAVVSNNVPGGAPFSMGGDPIASIPAVMVGNSDGLAVLDALLAGTTFTLDPAGAHSIPDRLQAFTSQGPRGLDSALKPDVSAPGGDVMAAAVGTGTGAVSFSGTSMAAPHVTGAAALLRQLHPDWSVEEIKALLMNTATNNSPGGEPYPVSLMGAGRVRVDVAAATESVVTPASLSFGVAQEDRAGLKVLSRRLTVANKSQERKTFQLSAGLLFAADDEGSLRFNHPSIISLAAGQSRTFDFSIVASFRNLAPEAAFEEYDGFLTLSELFAGGDVLRVPFHVVPIARAHAEGSSRAGQLEFRNSGMQSTPVDVYQLGVSDPNEDLIAEAVGLPNRPDDWFDISHTGAHAFDTPIGRVVEFAVAVHGNRSAANPMVTEVFLDVDKDGTPDYVVVAADLGLFLTGTFDGRMITALFELTTGAGVPEFLISDERNASWQTLPFLVDDLNLLANLFGAPTLDLANPDFTYFAVTSDVDTGSFDASDSAGFNAFAPGLDTVPNFFFLAPGERTLVDVTGTAQAGQFLALFYNNVSGTPQSQVIEVKG
ncbi:MAG: S8 family serine peptidase [Chloroflexi bacterium]|nr:S8 family serine peptidase [Chloroflexota bacterium]